MMAREQGNLEPEEVSKELRHREPRAVRDDQQQEQRSIEVREGGESSTASAAAATSRYYGASAEESKREVSVMDDRHHGSPVSAEVPVPLDHAGEPRSAGESSRAALTTEDALVVSTGKKRSKKGRTWKKSRGKQKANKDVSEPDVELLSIRVDEPPPAPETTTISSSTLTSAAPQESYKKRDNEDDHGSGNGLELQTDSTADSTQVDDQSGSQVTGENDSLKDILDFEDEQKYEIGMEAGLAAASSRSTVEWGLCVEDERGPPLRIPPRTPPLREPRVKNKGQVQGREPPSPRSHQSSPSPSASPREPWKRKPLEFRGRHEYVRSSSIPHPQSPAVTSIEAHKLEGLSEWNRIKAMQHSAAAEVASHKNWIPRKGIQRGGEAGDHNRGRGKAKQGRGEQNSQLNHNHHMKELVRQKFEADLRIKQEELLQRSKLSLKAEFQKAKRIEASRKGRDDLELALERNLVYCDGELIYLNQ